MLLLQIILIIQQQQFLAALNPNDETQMSSAYER